MLAGWTRYCFEPLDVLMPGDARPLGSGNYGHDGEFSPASVAGALRTAIIRRAVTRDPSLVESARRCVGAPPNDVSFPFRFRGPFARATTGPLLMAVPRDQLVLAGEYGPDRLQPLTVPAGANTHSSDAAAEGLEILRSPLAPSGEALFKARRDERLVDVATLCRILAHRIATHPGCSAAWDNLSRTLTAENFWDRGEVKHSERRHGHERDAERLVAAEGQLFSRGAERFHEVVTSKAVATGGYVGFMSGVDSSLLPDDGTLVRLGGDGRLAQLSAISTNEDDAPPRALRSAIEQTLPVTGRFSIYVSTPALMAAGWRPRPLMLDEVTPFPVRLVAAAVGAGRPIGGWDLAHKRPKPLRRTCAAGSMYFYELTPGIANVSEVIGALLDRYHFGGSISDFDAELGFGCTAVGLW